MFLLSRLRQKAAKAVTATAVRISNVLEEVLAGFSDRRACETDLLIVDDFFPGVLSAFRVAEYNYYLENISHAEVHSLRPSNLLFHSSGSFQEKHAEYSRYFPDLQDKVKRFSKRRIPSCRLVYTVFINNAYSFIEDIDRCKLPFAFTLYPGGGFHLNDAAADMKLRRVLSSPNFRKVFVTQKITRQYLLENQFCEPEDIVFIYGCVLPSQHLSRLPLKKRVFKADKDTLDICFVAAKYTPRGVDKGYDVFVEVAKELCASYPDINFHVVGSFDSADVDVSSIRDRITFYGLRNTDFFPAFYSGMDIILSPNVPFVLAPGAFDGFPTGSCMEAGLCGVAVFCSDPLEQNTAFREGEEIVIIPKAIGEIVRIVAEYREHPEELSRLAENGRKAFGKAFDLNAQMSPRMKVLEQLLTRRTTAAANI